MSDEAKELAIKKLAEAIAAFTIQGHVSSQTLAVDLYEASYRRIDTSKLKPKLVAWITAYKDAVERTALAETPEESADYLVPEIERQLKEGG